MSLTSRKDPTFDELGNRKPHKNSRLRIPVTTPQGPLAIDLARGRLDGVFFAERFLGVRLNRGQRRFVRAACRRAANGWGPAFLDIAVSAGNRAGKTLALAILVLHHAFYKMGVRPPVPGDKEDLLRWIRTPYSWYHISYEGKVSRLVYNELVLLLTSSHPAQYDREVAKMRGCPLVEAFSPSVVQWDRKYDGEYPWIVVHPMFGGGQVHFRHTNEKAKALLGLDMHGISFDEAAFELYLDTVRHEVLNLRRLATGGPILYISTPTEGYNAFADLWEEGNPENPHRNPRILSMRLSTRDNIGYGLTQENFDEVVAGVPAHLIPQNIDGHFIEGEGAYFHAPAVDAIFDPEMEDEQEPQRNHRYIQGADLGLRHDASWGLVLDHTVKPWLGVRVRKRAGRQSIPSVVNMVREGHLLFQQDGAACTSIIDDTGMGGKMYREEMSVIRPLRTYDFAGTKGKKLNLLANLRTVIDKGGIRLPRRGPWLELRRQLLGYRLDDSKLETDGVMTLAMAVWHASRNPDNPLKEATFSYFGGSD